MVTLGVPGTKEALISSSMCGYINPCVPCLSKFCIFEPANTIKPLEVYISTDEKKCVEILGGKDREQRTNHCHQSNRYALKGPNSKERVK